jgi:hypothetical protein
MLSIGTAASHLSVLTVWAAGNSSKAPPSIFHRMSTDPNRREHERKRSADGKAARRRENCVHKPWSRVAKINRIEPDRIQKNGNGAFCFRIKRTSLSGRYGLTMISYFAISQKV